jgi:hypothetical protein
MFFSIFLFVQTERKVPSCPISRLLATFILPRGAVHLLPWVTSQKMRNPGNTTQGMPGSLLLQKEAPRERLSASGRS